MVRVKKLQDLTTKYNNNILGVFPHYKAGKDKVYADLTPAP